jgi:hypothetical protein
VVTTPRLVFADFMVPGADPRVYGQVSDMGRLVKVVEEYLEDYNSVSSGPMRLVMFLDAIEHVSRITRCGCGAAAAPQLPRGEGVEGGGAVARARSCGRLSASGRL